MAQTRNKAERLIESFTPLPLRRSLAIGEPVEGEPGDGPVALLWLDIVGSTRIADLFVESGPRGIEQLAALLRRHFDTLLGAVVAHGGEPMMFAGDALLAGWRSAANDPREALLRAASCGQAILDPPGLSLPSGASLEMHAILALGPCRSIEISAGLESLCTATGKGLADLRATARERFPGRLLLSPAARAALANAVEVEAAGREAFVLTQLRDAPSPESLSIPTLGQADVERLRANVPLPIVNRLDSDDLEWSAELRRVTAVFIALPEDLEPDAPDIITKLEDVISAVSPVVRQQDGYLQQLEIADKGIKLLVLFGVPPVAHSDDRARGVLFGHRPSRRASNDRLSKQLRRRHRPCLLGAHGKRRVSDVDGAGNASEPGGSARWASRRRHQLRRSHDARCARRGGLCAAGTQPGARRWSRRRRMDTAPARPHRGGKRAHARSGDRAGRAHQDPPRRSESRSWFR